MPDHRQEPDQEKKSPSHAAASGSKREQEIPERCIICAKSLKDNPQERFNNPSVSRGA